MSDRLWPNFEKLSIPQESSLEFLYSAPPPRSPYLPALPPHQETDSTDLMLSVSAQLMLYLTLHASILHLLVLEKTVQDHHVACQTLFNCNCNLLLQLHHALNYLNNPNNLSTVLQERDLLDNHESFVCPFVDVHQLQAT